VSASPRSPNRGPQPHAPLGGGVDVAGQGDRYRALSKLWAPAVAAFPPRSLTRRSRETDDAVDPGLIMRSWIC
jgi:hypothetical protein